MKDLIKVRIDKASKNSVWYSNQIGLESNVIELNNDKSFWRIPETNLLILKSDCTILSDTGEKDEPKEWVPQVGEWAYILQEGILRHNVGDVFEIKEENINNMNFTNYPLIYKGDKFSVVSKQIRKALPHEILAPEPKEVITFETANKIIEFKGWCIKRTPENAEVLNKWANKQFTSGFNYNACEWYILSTPLCIEYKNLTDRNIPDGFIELFTVEEFFEKVNYKPELTISEVVNVNSNDFTESKPEPVLIAKAGEWVKPTYIDKFSIITNNNGYGLVLNEPVLLDKDLYSDSPKIYIRSRYGIQHNESDLGKTKFEKVSAPEEQVKEESERIPFDLEKWRTGKFDVVQRNGDKCEILKHDLPINQSILAINLSDYKPSKHYQDGHFELLGQDSKFDLFLLPKIETVWVNIFSNESNLYGDKKTAEDYGKHYAELYKMKLVETKEVKRTIK